MGIEPTTPRATTWCSTNWATTSVEGLVYTRAGGAASASSARRGRLGSDVGPVAFVVEPLEVDRLELGMRRALRILLRDELA
jgi:hypothetical protein